MLGALLRNLREPDAIPRIADPAVVAATYRRRRNQILLASMVGYGLFYFCRKNISVALTTMPVELDLSPAALGVLNSTIYVTYAISKGASGLVADRANPRTLLLLGLALSVLVNAAFGLSESLTALAVLWALNGVAQGLGAPACS